MSVEVGADDLVEDACVDDDSDHREHRRERRGDGGADGTRHVTIDHEDRRQHVHGGDDSEHDERGARNSPEPLSIRAQRCPDHVLRARASTVA